MDNLTVNASRTTFTENEVFGSECQACGWTNFDRATPTECAECHSTRIDSAEGCSIPYDDQHTVTAQLTGTVEALALWMHERGLAEWDGGSTVYAIDGSTIIDYGDGMREELTVSGDVETLTAIVAEMDAMQAAYRRGVGIDYLRELSTGDAERVDDRELYR